MSDPKIDAILGAAGAIGLLIKAVADAMGEPIADVRARVLAQVKADAADPTDETDKVSAEIDADLPPA
jgi:NADPH:quinone reductase-like Zn-dependent oxidoreductase